MDGEGCFTIGTSRHRYYSVQVNVANTDEAILQRIQSFTGGHLRFSRGKGNQRDYYALGWRTDELLQLLPQLIPYLRLKRRQAEIVYQFLVEHTRGSYHGKFVPESSKLLRKVLFDELRLLNVRGKKAVVFVGP
jgi:hypothetical protein